MYGNGPHIFIRIGHAATQTISYSLFEHHNGSLIIRFWIQSDSDSFFWTGSGLILRPSPQTCYSFPRVDNCNHQREAVANLNSSSPFRFTCTLIARGIIQRPWSLYQHSIFRFRFGCNQWCFYISGFVSGSRTGKGPFPSPRLNKKRR